MNQLNEGEYFTVKLILKNFNHSALSQQKWTKFLPIGHAIFDLLCVLCILSLIGLTRLRFHILFLCFFCIKKIGDKFFLVREIFGKWKQNFSLLACCTGWISLFGWELWHMIDSIVDTKMGQLAQVEAFQWKCFSKLTCKETK